MYVLDMGERGGRGSVLRNYQSNDRIQKQILSFLIKSIKLISFGRGIAFGILYIILNG